MESHKVMFLEQYALFVFNVHFINAFFIIGKPILISILIVMQMIINQLVS